MNYFILKQDRDLENAIEIEGFNNSKKMILFKENESTFKDSTNIPIKCNENSVYPDFIQAPVLLVSDEIHKVFKMYENTIVYKLAFFTSLKMKIQKVYRLVLTDTIDALSDKTTYFKNGWVDKIILDKKKIGDYNIFQIKAGVEYYFVVSLDVAESILKRRFTGIKFEKVEVI
ncbi:hypothetical protein [Clostridium sp. M14]|uniref:hypothetical protein n=1 Tax=Clostridium sp. M14 TaxID=2716311 RepID=UPI0013EE807E|nr:hypothetical protein [Clostridium sp. M14]MBZ9691436.1 hypothetical protein [Clostridium sp. M14]